METFMLLFVAALLVESVINIIKNIQEKETSWKYWGSLGLGLVVSILVAINWDIDLFKMVGFPDGRLPFVGAALTGLIISRGSNVVSDLIGLVSRPSA